MPPKYTEFVAKPQPSAEEVPWHPNWLWDWVTHAQALPDAEWLVPEFIPADSCVIVTGKAKIAFKTWFVMGACLCLASGKSVGPFKPTFPEGVPVLFIEAEGPHKLTSWRWIKLSAGLGIDLADISAKQKFMYVHREHVMLDDPKWIERLAKLINYYNFKVVVFDTLAKVNSGDENRVQDMSHAMRMLDFLRNLPPRPTVMYLHHLRKPTNKPGTPLGEEDIDDEMRGSTALSGFYDTHMAFREDGTGNRYRLKLKLRHKEGSEREFKIEWFIDEPAELGAKAYFKLRTSEGLDDEDIEACRMQLSPLQTYSPTKLCALWGRNLTEIQRISEALIAKGAAEFCERGRLRLKGGSK